jgi:hypothetical protein
VIGRGRGRERERERGKERQNGDSPFFGLIFSALSRAIESSETHRERETYASEERKNERERKEGIGTVERRERRPIALFLTLCVFVIFSM